MKTPVPDYLAELLDTCMTDTSGSVADYIPELATVDPDKFGLALCTHDGELYSAGDDRHLFTIQSISKPFVYALALADRGLREVLSKVAVEPSGDAFNEISMESDTGRPRNPMINIGAVTTYALTAGPEASAEERIERVRAGLSAFAGRDLRINEAVYESELSTSYRNLALANLVRSRDVITGDPREIVAGYTRQCSYEVDVTDLAVMAMTLAAGGVNPRTGDQVVPSWVCRQVLSVMATCGMYDAAGDWMSTVGIPAKSGVSGGILGALPGQIGIGAFSPRLDSHGHSIVGVEVCEKLSADMGMHLMEVPPDSVDVVRTRKDVRDVDDLPDREGEVIRLQGPLTFASVERLLRQVEALPKSSDDIVFDLRRVTSLNAVARRMLLEGMRRLMLDGHQVGLVDPDDWLPDPDVGDGRRPYGVDVSRSGDAS